MIKKMKTIYNYHQSPVFIKYRRDNWTMKGKRVKPWKNAEWCGKLLHVDFCDSNANEIRLTLFNKPVDKYAMILELLGNVYLVGNCNIKDERFQFNQTKGSDFEITMGDMDLDKAVIRTVEVSSLVAAFGSSSFIPINSIVWTNYCKQTFFSTFF